MRKLRDNIEWFLDFYVAYFLYNSKKLHRYHKYMIGKWGKRYTDYFYKE
jgi:hypothetical protein